MCGGGGGGGGGSSNTVLPLLLPGVMETHAKKEHVSTVKGITGERMPLIW